MRYAPIFVMKADENNYVFVPVSPFFCENFTRF